MEFSYTTPVDHGDHTTTGTVNPGFIWMCDLGQVGLEAILPINHATGSGVGVVAQIHLFLDDMFPATIGKPLF